MKHNLLKQRMESAFADQISEFAYGRVDEDGLSKEQIMEAHEEEIGEIKCQDPQDTDENRLWENGYAEGYSQGLKEAFFIINKEEGIIKTACPKCGADVELIAQHTTCSCGQTISKLFT